MKRKLALILVSMTLTTPSLNIYAQEKQKSSTATISIIYLDDQYNQYNNCNVFNNGATSAPSHDTTSLLLNKFPDSVFEETSYNTVSNYYNGNVNINNGNITINNSTSNEQNINKSFNNELDLDGTVNKNEGDKERNKKQDKSDSAQEDDTKGNLISDEDKSNENNEECEFLTTDEINLISKTLNIDVVDFDTRQYNVDDFKRDEKSNTYIDFEDFSKAPCIYQNNAEEYSDNGYLYAYYIKDLNASKIYEYIDILKYNGYSVSQENNQVVLTKQHDKDKYLAYKAVFSIKNNVLKTVFYIDNNL